MTELRFRFWVVCILVVQTLLLIYFVINTQASENNRAVESQHLTNLLKSHSAEISQLIALQQMAVDFPHQSAGQPVHRAETKNDKTQTAAQPTTTITPVLTEKEINEQEQQYSNSDAIISSAIAIGTWTEQDTRALIPHLANLSYEQRIALLEKFHSAVNRQELNLESFPPL